MMLQPIYHLLRWRDLVFNLVLKEVKVRYMGTLLGFAWSLGNPLSITLVYYIVFTFILPTGQDRFALHLVTGVIHWTLLAQALPQSCDWLIGNRNLILKIRFPRILIPISGMITTGIFWLAALVVYWLLYPLMGGEISINLIWYPIIVITFAMFVFGLGLMLCILQVLHHDIRHLVEVIVPIFFWLTPIVWVSDALPENVRQWTNYNPLAAYFDALSQVLHDGRPPGMVDLSLCILMGSVALIIGLLVFKKVNRLVEII